MAELEKVKRDQSFYKAFANLKKLTKKTLERAYNLINVIDTARPSEEKVL